MPKTIFRLILLLFFTAIFIASLSALQIIKPGRNSAVQAAQFTPPPPSSAYEKTLFINVSNLSSLTTARSGKDKITGQAWGDYDNDGWLDLYLTDTGGPNTLYRNNQDGTFSPSPFSEIVSLPEAISGGATFADYNNDGWSDLYVMNWGENTLFRNEGGNGFSDVTAEAGVGNKDNGKTASWGDYDQDGYLDLYVANWACSPKCGRASTGDKDRLFHNNGDGTFSDATAALGNTTRGAGFVASFVDYDNDGDPDIYLVNDEFINPIGNILWRNDGPGCDPWCFAEVSEAAGANTKVMGMGLATGDYDNDGDLDFYFSNAGPMTLLQNQGNGLFTDTAVAAGVDLGREAIGWGAVFFDSNNDGLQDLYQALADRTDNAPPANPLFLNNGDGSFTNLGAASGAGDPGKTIGVAYADYNNDGWVDLVIGNYDSGYVLYQNQGTGAEENGRLAITLIGAGPVNRDAVGARVYLATTNGATQMQEVKNGSSLGSGNMLTLHFGLGESEVSQMKVVWPDGVTQVFENVPANRRIRLTYPLNWQTAFLQNAVLNPTLGWILIGLLILSVIGILAILLWQAADFASRRVWRRAVF